MAHTFNLVDQPWIPVTLHPRGSPDVLSLRDTLARASEIRDISDASPLVTISIHRLLLAILHRTHGPSDGDEWERIWEAGAFDQQLLAAYLDQWHQRFDLFDPERPFYQTIEVHTDYARSIAQMVYGMTLGNYVTLFDHSRQDTPPALRPAEAARQVLAIQNFAVGGLVPYQSKHGEPARPYKFAENSLLTKGAVALVRGRNLFETLMLNLHRYNGAASSPFEFEPRADLPAWERDTPARAEERLPDGYVDLLTWQSRRVRLIPEANADGETIVSRAVVMKGYQFPRGDIHLRDYETMLAFTHNPKATKGQDPWPVLSLRPARAVWRDSTALFQTTGDEHQRPRTLDWVAELTHDGALPGSRRYLVDIYGLATDRASVDLWRSEQLPLPVALLDNQDLMAELRRALELADAVSRLFAPRMHEIVMPGENRARRVPSPVQTLAENLLTMSDAMQPDREAVGRLAASLAPDETYWARLELPFKQFLLSIGEADTVSVRERWASAVRRAAREAWNVIFSSFDASARTLKAAVRADGVFDFQLNVLVNPYAPQRREEIADGEPHPAPTAVC